jgi:hypothetical protein
LSFDGQRRSAIPDFESDILYLDVCRGWPNRLYLRKVLHHEFFHILDYRDDGSVYEDPSWSELNPPEFAYGSGGRNAQGRADTSVLNDQHPGFLNHYSTTGVEEDKAEIFANLIVEPLKMKERVEADAVLRRKVDRLKELVMRFCPEIDEGFWRRAAERRDGGP